MTDEGTLSGKVGRALRWSTTGTVVVRLGNLGLGIVIARIVSPEEFGLYAIALTVQSVVMALADLGLSADLVRSPDFQRRTGPVAILGLVTGGTLTVITALSAPALASAMGGPGAAGPIAILAATFLLAGIGVVPFATLQRNLDQRGLFRSTALDFGVGAVVTLAFAAFGYGLVGLAVGRVAGQACGVAMQFWLTRTGCGSRGTARSPGPCSRSACPSRPRTCCPGCSCRSTAWCSATRPAPSPSASTCSPRTSRRGR